MEIGYSAAKRNKQIAERVQTKLSQRVNRVRRRIKAIRKKLRAAGGHAPRTPYSPPRLHWSKLRKQFLGRRGIRIVQVEGRQPGTKQPSVYVPPATLKNTDSRAFHTNKALTAAIAAAKLSLERIGKQPPSASRDAQQLRSMKEVSILSQELENQVMKKKTQAREHAVQRFQQKLSQHRSEIDKARVSRRKTAVLNAKIESDIRPAARVPPGWRMRQEKRTATMVAKGLPKSLKRKSYSSSYSSAAALMANKIISVSRGMATQRTKKMTADAGKISPTKPSTSRKQSRATRQQRAATRTQP